MKILVIDISHNASPSKAKAFIDLNSDADFVYVFDYRYYIYTSVKDLWSDLRYYPEDFFCKPCAYYDTITAILSETIQYSPDSITIFSPEVDECSRMSTEERFIRFIRHLNKYTPDKLHIRYSISESCKPQRPSIFNSIIDNIRNFSLWEHFSIMDTLNLDTVDDDDDDWSS